MCTDVGGTSKIREDRSDKLSRLSRLFTVRVFYRSRTIDRDRAIAMLKGPVIDPEFDETAESYDDSNLLDCSLSEILESLEMIDW